jgi:hypothetical protein
MRLVFGKSSMDTVRHALEAIHSAHCAELAPLLSRCRVLAAQPAAAGQQAALGATQGAIACAVSEAGVELGQAVQDFARAAAAEEANRIRTLERALARREIAWRRYRQEVLEAEAWTDGISDLAESVAARLKARLHEWPHDTQVAANAENSAAPGPR